VPYVELDTERPVWDRFLWAAPLVLIGTVEEDGSLDLAPKHMVTPMGWDNYFGFVCAPRHATYGNAIREDSFTVSYLGPEQLVQASLAAAPRSDEGDKPSLLDLPIVLAEKASGPLVDGAYVQLECRLERVVERFGANGLIIGEIVAARVHEDAARAFELEDQQLVAQSPLLVYVAPGQYARVDSSQSFPFPSGFTT
jgi:flavin reductase (DIM6/NTAB) family NADH-FMN oxidoreductase RutF